MADSNKISYGLKSVYYAVATIASDGSATYDTPVAFPGAVSLSMAAQGDTNVFYADNIGYYTSVANNGYEGELEMAYLPEDFLTDIMGNIKAANDILYEDAGAEPVHFALLFQFEGDANAVRHVLYNCVASRPDVASQTKSESIEPQTRTLNITATSIYVPAVTKDVTKGRCVEGDTAYANFFTAVAQPTI